MKYFSLIVLFSFLISLGNFTVAYTDEQIEAANFIATQGIINDNAADITKYNLSDGITRREMLKVMMNLSGQSVVDTCTGKFTDLTDGDWGCKYAEAGLASGFIAENENFRPDDSVTQIESLKMIMQAKGIERDDTEDWRVGYVTKAQSEEIIKESFVDYDSAGIRGWIFANVARTYDDFNYNPPENLELTPEEQELWDLLGL